MRGGELRGGAEKSPRAVDTFLWPDARVARDKTARAPRGGLKAVTWKMESADLATGRVVMVTVFSAESHSWMVTILRPGGGMWR